MRLATYLDDERAFEERQAELDERDRWIEAGCPDLDEIDAEA